MCSFFSKFSIIDGVIAPVCTDVFGPKPIFLWNLYIKPQENTFKTDLQKVATARPLVAATRTLLVPHSGMLGFIFWSMPFLELKNCGFGNYFWKTQSKLASFGIFTTFVFCFGALVLYLWQILYCKSRCFGATFHPCKKSLVPQNTIFAGLVFTGLQLVEYCI